MVISQKWDDSIKNNLKWEEKKNKTSAKERYETQLAADLLETFVITTLRR